MPKRVLEGATPAERALQRRKLGTLHELTVQPSTRQRYNKAVDAFLQYLKSNHLILPRKRESLDSLVCDYLEHLWGNGSGRALASDTLAGLQNSDPKLRGSLPGSWRLMKAWSVNEIPNRAPPMPEHVLQSLCGWACFHNHYSFAISLLIGFYGMMRTGEILGLKRKDFNAEPSSRHVLISLGLTKSGKRAGAAESVVIGHDTAVQPILRWMSLAPLSASVAYSPSKWRGLFQQALVALKIESFGFRPYSLRRGGATWWFAKHHSLDRLLLQGRWHSAKTARIYLNEGLSVLAELKLSANDPRIKSFLTIFRSRLVHPKFTTLEPPVTKTGRNGGHGKAAKSKNLRVMNV